MFEKLSVKDNMTDITKDLSSPRVKDIVTFLSG